MRIGVPKEIKTRETRVAVTPKTVQKLAAKNHTIFIEKDAGVLSGFSNRDYEQSGAEICKNAGEVWSESQLIVKVKEPLESEYAFLRPCLTIFTFLHLAGVPKLARALCEASSIGIGYETVETDEGELPLLTPMSEVAGRVATQVGTELLHHSNGGKGVLLGGVTGTKKGRVVVIGGGHVGQNAADVAAGLGAETIVLDVKEHKLKNIEERFGGRVKAIRSTPSSIDEWVTKADLLVGAVLVHGDKAPTVVSRSQVARMEPGSVIVDVAIDQGGCVETSHVTSHEAPTYTECGVIHYCVPNMPALTPRTSTEALTSATEPYLLKLAQDIDGALHRDATLAKGLQTKEGKVTLPVLQKLFPELA